MQLRIDNVEAWLSAHASEMDSSDTQCRVDFLRALGLGPFPEAVPYYLRGLLDPDKRVRRCAVYGLKEFGWDGQYDLLLVELLNHPVPSTRLAILSLLELVRSDLTLSRIGLLPTVALLADDDRAVRHQAARVLMGIPQGDLLKAVTQMPFAPSAQNRFHDRLLKIFLLREQSGTEDSSFGEDATDSDPIVRLASLVAVARQQGVVASLPDICLQDEDETVRRFAVFLLGEYFEQKYIDILIRALRDRTATVRAEATRVLGLTLSLDETVWDELAVQLLDNDPEVRAQACFSFWRIGTEAKGERARVLGYVSKQALRLLEELACDPDSDVRGAATLALGNLHPSLEDLRLQMIGRFGDAEATALPHLADSLFSLWPERNESPIDRASLIALAGHPRREVRTTVTALLLRLDAYKGPHCG